MKNLINFGLFITAFLFIFSSCSSDTTSSPRKVAEKYGEYLLSDKPERIVDLVDTGDASKEEIEAGKQMLSGFITLGLAEVKKAKDGFKDFEIISEDIDGDEAEVTIKITFGNGETDEESLDMVKVDGKWKLQMDM